MNAVGYTYAGLLGQLRAGLTGLFLPIALHAAEALQGTAHARKAEPASEPGGYTTVAPRFTRR